MSVEKSMLAFEDICVKHGLIYRRIDTVSKLGHVEAQLKLEDDKVRREINAFFQTDGLVVLEMCASTKKARWVVIGVMRSYHDKPWDVNDGFIDYAGNALTTDLTSFMSSMESTKKERATT